MQENGVVGAGGAGFPTYMKLTDKADTILMNCAECEPLLKLHRQLLEKHAYEIMKTFDMVAETVGASQAIIGIKKSYVQTINALNQHIEEFPRVKIHLLDEVYPMGDEVVLIYEATGRVVRPGGLPIEQGVAVFNVETLYNVYRAVEEHKPVTSKYVSVVAEVENPVTVKVPLGCTLEEVVAQAGVGVFDRVFETGPVFRAEKHNTKRHLNEYTGLDFEMGYINGFEDIMEMETGFLQYAVELLKKDYAHELSILKVELPKVDKIPAVRFDKAKELVAEKYKRKIRNPYDLEPEEEALIGRYFKEEYDADFVFVTHYPSKKRPFYAMDDPADEKFTLSFDLLFKGLEVTTGGQRIHDYQMLKDKIAARGMDEEGMEQYLDTFKHGMPPHGGLGIGLERLTMQILGEENVRETCLFPRDMNRLEP